MTWTSPLWLGGAAYGGTYLYKDSKGATSAQSQRDALSAAVYTSLACLWWIVVTGLPDKGYPDAKKKELKNMKQIKATERDEWIEKYRKREKLNYVLQQEYPDGRLYLKLPRDPGAGFDPSRPNSGLKWQPYSIFENKIFPSFVISFAEAGAELKSKNADISNLMGFKINSETNGKVVYYEIEPVEKDLIEGKSQGKLVLKQGTHEYFVDIPWKYQALRRLKQSTPLRIHFRVRQENASQFETQTETFDVRNIFDCLLRVGGTDFYELIAAYVQEQNPLIEDILKEGKDKKYISAWVGTQGSPTVDEQVEAVWRVLQDRGITYGEASIAKNEKGIFFQQIRTFSQSISKEQANCVDGTLVFCSILKRIGVSTFAVVVDDTRPDKTGYQGHCMLGYYDENGDPKIVETTVLGGGTSFKDALSIGLSSFVKYSKVEGNCHIVDIDKMRRAGVNSINTD